MPHAALDVVMYDHERAILIPTHNQLNYLGSID